MESAYACIPVRTSSLHLETEVGVLQSSLRNNRYFHIQLALCLYILLELAFAHPEKALLGIPVALVHLGLSALAALLKGHFRSLLLLLSLALALYAFQLLTPTFAYLLVLALFLLMEPLPKGHFAAGALALGLLYAMRPNMLWNYLPFLLLLLFIQHHLGRLLKQEALQMEIRRTQELRIDSLQQKILDLESENVRIEAFSASEERNRLAQELHDRLGHTVSGTILSLEAARLLMKKDPERTEALLGDSVNTLRSGMEDIRRTLKAVKPSPSELGITALRHQLGHLQGQSAIKTYLTFDGDLSAITYAQWQIFQDTLREAFTNTMRHAGASTFTLDIRVYPGLVRAEFKDNGTGCPHVKKGMGITGMEERLAKEGGELVVDGSRGFSTTLLFPRAKPQPPPPPAPESSTNVKE